MATIVTRTVKGSALTWTEADANISNLNTAKIENVVEDTTPQLGGALDVNGKDITSASNGNINISPNGSGNIALTPATGKIILGALDWPTVTGTNGQVLTTNGTTAATWATPSGGFTSFTVAGDSGTSQSITDGNTLTVVGGTNLNSVASATDTITVNLDTTVTGLTSLTSTTVVTDTIDGSTVNGPITIAPNGTGDLYLNADSVRVGDSNANATITTNGTGDLILSTNGGTSSGVITIQDGLDNDITVVPAGTGKVHFETSETRVGINNTNAKITTKGAGDLTLDTNSGTDSGSIVIADGVNGNISITPNGTGDVVLSADTVQVGDAGAAATITTNGAGNLVLNTNSGTNSGSITITQGANGTIAVAANGTGIVTVGSPTFGIFATSPGANIAPFTARHGTTTSASDTLPSFIAQKHRTDILLAAMTDEPVVYQFTVRDSSNTNRHFGRWIGRFQGTSTDPTFTLRGSADSFTTNNHYATFKTNQALLGTGTDYTITSGTGGALKLTANADSSSGVITVASGANGNITIAPNGTGDVQLDADTVRIGDSAAAATLTTNGAGNLTLSTNDNTSTGSITINAGANGNIAISPIGSGNIQLTPTTGKIVLGALDFPTSTGTNGQVLTTNGSSAATWTTPSAGGGAQSAYVYVSNPKGTLITGSEYRAAIEEWWDPSSIISVASNIVTCAAAGTYVIEMDNVEYVTNANTWQHKIFNNGSTGDWVDNTSANFNGDNYPARSYLVATGTTYRFSQRWTHVWRSTISNATFQLRYLLNSTADTVSTDFNVKIKITKL